MRGQPQRHFDRRTGAYSIALPYSTPDGLRGVILIARDANEDPDFISEMEQFEGSLVQLVKGVSAGLKFAAVWDRAIKDEATGLFNKNHFNKELPKILQATLKHSQPFSMIMLDIDKFKHVNDTFGHIPGDQVLAQVSAIMLENLRDGDMAFRYGGEELCILALNTVGDDAGAYAERIRTIIAHTEFRTSAGQLIPITASIGVAEFDPKTMRGEKELKEACDSALYFGKENGRNVAVVCEGQGKFCALERTGDIATEVKRRLGLAGDNQPLEEAQPKGDRRAATQKSGKVGQAIRDGDLEPLDDRMVTSESMRLDPGRSIRKLAEQIIAAADDNEERLAEVARIAEVAAV
ncbi:MAG: GGDEF domain-containing protein, partial [Planctomycetes bacterium]|nr:GGDEF domain-containing protein [Planctomycetota bacterium]